MKIPSMKKGWWHILVAHTNGTESIVPIKATTHRIALMKYLRIRYPKREIKHLTILPYNDSPYDHSNPTLLCNPTVQTKIVL